MKKNFFRIFIVVLFFFGMSYSIDGDFGKSNYSVGLSELIAQNSVQAESDYCPNGCLTYFGSCFCYEWQQWREASW